MFVKYKNEIETLLAEINFPFWLFLNTLNNVYTKDKGGNWSVKTGITQEDFLEFGAEFTALQLLNTQSLYRLNDIYSLILSEEI